VDDQQYDYQRAGYNGFMRRTLNSLPIENSLRSVGTMRAYKPQEINFDEMRVSGNLGDTLNAGRIHIKGPQGQIDVDNEEGEPMMRIGDQED
jgi:hypothetical protein